MNPLEALILGIVQGLTEFLPVSSSGHLAIGGTLFGLNGEENLTFAVAVHAATVLATIVVLRKEIWRLVRSLFTFRWEADTQMICKILLSMIPVAIVGVFLKDSVEALFGSGLLIVGIMLLLTALLLVFSHFSKAENKATVSFRDAFVIGIAQACAVMPGLSRSGATIATGIMLGIKREDVAKFSFLMVVIPVLGEASLDLLKGDFSASSSGLSAFPLIIGFVAAFISGVFACRFMIKLVSKGKLIYFAYYCAIVGLFAITWSLIR